MIINLPMKDTPLTFKFYSVCPQIPDRNAIIDDLESWLLYSNSLVTTIVSTNPFELSMTQFKLNGSDSNAFIVSAQIQYMSVTWNTKYHAYYWVKKISRSSNDVITLDIELDFLNTLHNGDDELGSPLYNFHATSSIERQHENRFVEFELQQGSNLVPTIIDKVSEGVNPQLYRIPVREYVEPTPNHATDYKLDSHIWYLVYARGNDNKITCYLVPDTSDDIKLKIVTGGAVVWGKCVNMSILKRDSSKIAKIIRCPYCPINVISRSGDNWEFDNRFSVKVHEIDIFDFDISNALTSLEIDLTESSTNNEQLKCFKRTLNDYVNTSFGFGATIEYTSQVAALGESRHIRDPKLFNSEFYGIYFVYDSSVWQLKPELYEGDTTSFDIDINYSQSSSIDSSLTFNFIINNYLSDDYYSLVMVSKRQNEVVAYSDDFMNYIRNGYNYDIAKQTLNNFVSIGSSAIGLASSTMTANPVGVVGSVLALGSSIARAGTSEIDRQKNLRTMAQSSFNVSGVNDSSLFEDYGEGKLKRVVLQPSEIEEKRWSDIFHFYGYNRGGIMGVPNVTSRVWFNFLKGEIVLGSANFIPLWLYEKVKAKYREGVTYYHSQMVNGYKAWDLTQEKENYETFLLDL